jgi:trehalose/maltose hydrolase-like predicted phosphorylase
MRESAGSVETLSQSLSMESGELVTRMRLAAAGTIFTLDVLQFVSRSIPCLLCQELSLRAAADADAEVGVTTLIDTAGLPGQVYTGDTDPFTRGWYTEDRADRCVGFSTDRSRIGITTVVERGPDVRRKGPGEYTVHVRAGQPAVFRIIAALVPDTSSPEPHLEAVRMARWGDMLGFETLRRDNRDAWAELWKSRIRITGSADDQRALDAAFYYYHSCIHPSTRGGIPPFGLAHHDKYYGHVFWDMDMWMLIPAILAAPGSARAIAQYRVRGLESARRRAALFGYRGAQFPWEAAFDGAEVTPSCCPTGWAEQHVTPGVAIGAWEYQQAAGDRESLRSVAWPILQAVAEWIESRGHFTDRGFEVGHMMGPDEGITNLSNQTYFNLLSSKAMAAALECAGRLGIEPPASWRRIRDRMVVPRQGDIVLPYDPGSVDAYSLGNLAYLFLHGCPVDERLFRATWHHEEKLRLERVAAGGVPGSSNAVGFTTPPWAVCAAFFGDRGKAEDLFIDSWKSYWTEPFGMVKEAASQDYGGFVTNHGSLLQSALLGFTGLRIRDGDWAQYPASLPAGWERIEVDRIWVRGNPMALSAVQGKKAALKATEG